MEKYFKVLGIDTSQPQTADSVKKSWRKKCNENHPDKGGDKDKFMEIMHAYKMLTDASYRDEQSKKTNLRNLDINMQVPVDFESAFFGRPFVITFARVELDELYEPVAKKEQDVVSVTIHLPPGSTNGYESTFSGLGVKRGEAYGDLNVSIKPKQHKKYRVDGINVVVDEQIPLDIMLKGGEVEVQTLYGIKRLIIPAGTVPNDMLKIKRCGVGGIGSHIVVVHPIYPTKQDLKNKTSWGGLYINWEIQTPEEDEMAAFENLFRQNLVNWRTV